MSKKTWHILCQWQVTHTFHVEADTLKEAKTMLEDAEPPYDVLPKGNYEDDTFEVLDAEDCTEIEGDAHEEQKNCI